MASTTDNFYNVARHHQQQPQPPHHGHQRSKSGVLRFIHRRNNSDGQALPSAPLTSSAALPRVTTQLNVNDMRAPNFSRHQAALGEIQTNKMDGPVSRSPDKHAEQPGNRRSPTKTFSTISFRNIHVKDSDKAEQQAKQKENLSPIKPKKTKSATNLVGLLGRPKSNKNLHKLASEDNFHDKKGKENRTPPSSLIAQNEDERPPIYAQFSSGALEKQNGAKYVSSSNDLSNGIVKKPRPQSCHAQYMTKPAEPKSEHNSVKASPTKSRPGLRVFTNGFTSKRKPSMQPPTPEPGEFVLDPKDVDKHLEAMLDRRNIPENQRYKMRNLASTIKMEFIRQDWAETNMNRPSTHDSDSSTNEGQEKDDSKGKRSRRGFTLSKSGKRPEPSSPKKQKGDSSIGRHFRSKSTDSVASERPSSAGSCSGGGILSKIKLQQGPVDFVAYLRKVQKPQQVEVGKLHKLRLLLRNETVAWTEEFIRQGGMQEIVSLLHRIMEVEWREEHEDALLHENLLCLKALCTTALALQYLHSIQATLFPALLHLIFDPEKKGPSEFTTRGIITSVLFTYIQSAPPQDRIVRARTILGHLKDPEPKEDQRPLPFVLEMRRDRPYRVWCKEVVSVTKEVFWIFLHHLNVVYLPRDMERNDKSRSGSSIDSLEYIQAHFPQERPPVPAAPYVGGVEWDATNYLASHLDLLNAILACTPTAQERNKLRDLLKISGWERCMGGSLRLCKEKFYPGVHDALRTWVAAAAEDGWDVRDVRYGPPPEPKSPVRKQGGAAAERKPKKEEEPAPKIDMPKISLDLGAPPAPIPAGAGVAKRSENWLS